MSKKTLYRFCWTRKNARKYIFAPVQFTLNSPRNARRREKFQADDASCNFHFVTNSANVGTKARLHNSVGVKKTVASVYIFASCEMQVMFGGRRCSSQGKLCVYLPLLKAPRVFRTSGYLPAPQLSQSEYRDRRI